MAKRRGKNTVSRILVVVDTSPRSLHVLQTAAALAAQVHAELEMLFVEDINLFHLAALPFTRELDRTSGEERAVDQAWMDQTLRIHVRHVRRALSAATQSLQIQSSLRVVRGHYIHEALSDTYADVVFIKGTARASFSNLKEIPRAQHPVYTLYDGSPTAERSVSLAHQLANALRVDLVILTPSNTGQDVETLHQQADRIVGDKVNVRWITIASADVQSFKREIQSTKCSLLVLSREYSTAISQSSGGLFDVVDCPLVLVA